MKKAAYFFFMAATIICLNLLIISSCNKKEIKMNGGITEDNKIIIEDKFYSVINYSEDFVKKDDFSFKQNLDVYKVSQKNADMNLENLALLLADLKTNFHGDLDALNESPRFIAIYTDPSLINIKFEKITAISIITADNLSLKHHYYKIEDSVAVTDTTWNKRLTVFYNFFLQFFAINFGDNNTGILLISSTEPFPFDYTGKPPYNDLNTSVIDFLNSPNLRPISPCGSTFGSRCPDPGDNCVNVPDGPPTCKSPAPKNDNLINPSNCNARTTNSVIISTGSALALLDIQQIEFVKESVLKKYIYGQKYIKYYELISSMSYYFDLIHPTSLNAVHEFHLRTQNVLIKFADPNSTEIPITKEYKDIAMSFANQYKSLTNNTYVQEAIQTFIYDLNRFEGKTVKQILSEIE